jgi:hypothetical protein
MHVDCVDHVIGIRSLNMAPFYDVGEAYLNGQPIGNGVAHAFGIGTWAEISWFSFIERSIFRVDVAKAVNTNTPWQVWFGIEHPF